MRYTQASIFDIRTMSIDHEYRGENMITTAAVWSTLRVFLEATKRATMNYFPHGSKSEALRLGVHLILLYFIWISLWTPETFFLFGRWMVDGGWRVAGGVQLF